MFIPAIFIEKFWRSIKAWGYHGFMPKRKPSSAQNQVQHQGNPIQNNHAELSGALDSFRECGPRLRGVVADRVMYNTITLMTAKLHAICGSL
jgi:hypothetical protein